MYSGTACLHLYKNSALPNISASHEKVGVMEILHFSTVIFPCLDIADDSGHEAETEVDNDLIHKYLLLVNNAIDQ